MTLSVILCAGCESSKIKQILIFALESATNKKVLALSLHIFMGEIIFNIGRLFGEKLSAVFPTCPPENLQFEPNCYMLKVYLHC